MFVMPSVRSRRALLCSAEPDLDILSYFVLQSEANWQADLRARVASRRFGRFLVI